MTEIGKAYFVGDVHLDARLPAKEAAFCAFLDEIKSNRPEILFLMGDIFEFWFGYKTVMFAQTIRTVSKIFELASAGIRVIYIVGNHDFEPGPVFEEIMGIEIKRLPFIFQFNGKRVYLSHGDEINTEDRGYRFIKAVLRNKFAQFLFKCIPASIAWQIGRLTSDTSREYTKMKKQVTEDVYRRFLKQRINEGVSIVIHGHSHEPQDEVYDIDGDQIRVINHGHWFGPGYYVKYENGDFRLCEYPL